MGVFCGRRWAKTIGCFRNRGVLNCLTKPGRTKPFFAYLYLAPKAGHCHREWTEYASNPNLAKYIVRAVKQPYPRIEFINGSYIEFRNIKIPANLRGNEYDEIWMDEIQDDLYGEDMFNYCVKPLVLATQGTIIVSGQYRGYNWYHQEFNAKAIADVTGTRIVKQYPSWTGLMFQSDRGRAEIIEWKESLPPQVWKQEIECLPDNNPNSAFDIEHYRKQIVKNLTTDQFNAWCAPKENKSYLMAIDLGGKHDYEAVDIVEVDSFEVQKEPARVVYSDRFKGLDHAVMARRCEQIFRRYNIHDKCRVWMDTTLGGTGGQAVSDAYTKEYRKAMPSILPFYWGKGNRDKVIRQVSLDVEHENFLIPEQFTHLNTEMQEFEFRYNKTTGMYKYCAPPNKHDDHVMALMICLWKRYIGDYVKTNNRMGSLSAMAS